MIKSEKQIDRIRELGLTHVTCVLSKCDTLPVPLEEAEGRREKSAAPEAPKAKTPISREILGLKRETIERNRERRAAFARCEKKYDRAVSQVVTILRRASGKSDDAVSEASVVVGALVDTFLSDRDVVLNLMSSKPQDEQKNYHALNVTVLSMMVGRDLKLGSEAMTLLGMGALFHDIGRGRVPIQMLDKGRATSMNRIVAEHMKQHPVTGARLAEELASFPPQAVPVILQHHEALDGSGYPHGLRGKSLHPLARIVAVTNAYDNLLNDREKSEALTPHEAIRRIYASGKSRFDERVLGTFIRCMGVYPPGTVVKLSNGAHGMVTVTNPANAARPCVLIYHPEVPKAEALIVDLTVEDGLNVSETLRPEALPKEIFNYLSPSRSINYYADTVD